MVKPAGFSQDVTSKNGTYYVGMTKNQAQKSKIYQAKIGIDFKDLDKDGNGKLSQEEILQGRVKAAKRDAFGAGFVGLGAYTTAAVGLIATPGSGGATTLLAAANLVGGTATRGKGISDYQAAQRELEIYQAQLANQNSTNGENLDIKQ